MGLRFEWDQRKADSNLKKHGVSFQEAASVFADALRSRYRIQTIQRRKPASSTWATLTATDFLWYRILRAVKLYELLAPGAPAGLSENIMKTKPIRYKKSPKPKNDPMRAEYDFSKGMRGKHAAHYATGTNVVVIEPDVSAEFPTAEEVNETLRAVAQLLQRRRKSMKRKTA